MIFPAEFKNFTIGELKCPLTGGYKFHPQFPYNLQYLRDICGIPFYSASCCRSRAYNDSLKNSSPFSLHIYDNPQREGQEGTMAIDLRVKDSQIRHHILRNALLLNWSAYIIKGGNIHVDMRHLIGEPLKFWA